VKGHSNERDRVGVFKVGDFTINRLGYGAMRITGPGVWGPPSGDQAGFNPRSTLLGSGPRDTWGVPGPSPATPSPVLPACSGRARDDGEGDSAAPFAHGEGEDAPEGVARNKPTGLDASRQPSRQLCLR
jgi:hypothetical protein